MPPRAKITAEMVVDAGVEVVRACGAGGLSVRTVSQELGCSTQPVMYHFRKMEELRQAVYRRADQRHSAYITAVEGEEAMLEIGLRYIRFAAEEKNLFRFLFQSDGFAGQGLPELLDARELAPILELLGRTAGADGAQARTIFQTVFLYVHGYASMLANNSMEYDASAAARDLERVWAGAVYAAKEVAE